jgi:hypothetical protein
MAKEFTIDNFIENTLQNSISLCRLLEGNPEKAIKQIKEIVCGDDDAKLLMLVQALNFCLKTHPAIFYDLKSKLRKEEPRLLVTLLEAGLNAP